VQNRPAVTTFLFTDIEGSTRLWEREPERMKHAHARHDALARAAVEAQHGLIVKMTGDGVHAAFDDPLDAVAAALELQQALADPAATNGIALCVRCGLDAGVVERRDNDYFGTPVNRAARIMAAAHGGQVLVSEPVAALVRERLPHGVSLRDLGIVRFRDLTNLERVHQVLHPRIRADFPALRTLETTPNNLAQQATTFIGREREIADVKQALGGARLLTLTGVGGIGKTRLSLQVAAEVLDDFAHGVWFVELAPITDEHLVPQAVASVLGVKEEAGRPVTEALVKHLADRNLLLVLDNCEHVVQACSALAEQLLRASRGLWILASSREPLRVSGEVTMPVSALAVPAVTLHDPIAVEAMASYPAVRLFVDRATAVLPTFRLTDHNARAVAEICLQLDGIPLAIELAAARVRALSVENIATRLNDRFRLLTGGSRTALARQQTLRAAIDWSYDLLTEKETILFRRLAVFSAGWALDAAEAVCSGGDIGDGEVLGLLADLIDQSLVVVEAEGGRYRLLETIRQYADERLTQSGEGDATRARHLAFFLAFAEKMAPDLLGPEQASGLQRIDVERENILSAHGWAMRMEGGAEPDYCLVHAIKYYWFMRGLLNLGHRVTAEAVARSEATTTSISRCRALWVAGQISGWMGRYEEAQRYLQESLRAAQALGDERTVVSVLNSLTLAALGQGDRATARVHCQSALKLANQLGNKRQIATASNAMAQIYRLEGELDAAEPLYERTALLGHELGDRDMAAVGVLNLAMVAIARGATGRARGLVREVLSIAEQTGSKPAGQSALEVSAGLAAVGEDWEHAARFFGMAERQAGNSGIRRDPADEAFLRPLISKTREVLGEARFASAHASGRALNFEQVLAEAGAWLSSER
jgi:predicted ATPase/class 3 adenylate cyclase